ncbi:predicted protein [Naegleria gruberi]|uniref:Predicted protein n=1 Tax=Naegleria gruberi TaxID=5762 RepID=D2W126_NAEGR|nr:uncharacterized protein NAEGRDRAFT_75065 [Naegleria gruberi]EFC37286.1 predicted protein [Naegleria gruberi]|eukprot:XP_002670030.1 predicted protein [Naegleria gruberi strain NEG-M]
MNNNRNRPHHSQQNNPRGGKTNRVSTNVSSSSNNVNTNSGTQQSNNSSASSSSNTQSSSPPPSSSNAQSVGRGGNSRGRGRGGNSRGGKKQAFKVFTPKQSPLLNIDVISFGYWKDDPLVSEKPTFYNYSRFMYEKGASKDFKERKRNYYLRNHDGMLKLNIKFDGKLFELRFNLATIKNGIRLLENSSWNWNQRIFHSCWNNSIWKILKQPHVQGFAKKQILFLKTLDLLRCFY